MRLSSLDKEARKWIAQNYPKEKGDSAIKLYESFKAGYYHKKINEENKYSMSSIYDIIIHTVCQYYDTTYEYINIKSRKRELVQARQISMYLGGEFTKLSLEAIGEAFGKDHSTVLHSIKTVNNLIDTNSNIRYDVEVIRKQVLSKTRGTR